MKNSLIIIFTAFLISNIGCQSLPDSGGESGGGAPPNSAQDASATSGSAGGQSASSGAAATAPQRKAALPASQDLDLQANHANGTVLRVTRVDFADDSIKLAFAVTNGHRFNIKLNQGGMQLRDNAGNVYNIVPPQANGDIEVATNSTLNGTLSFLGRISPSANSLTLTTNHRFSIDTGEYTVSPKIVIANIPVQR